MYFDESFATITAPKDDDFGVCGDKVTLRARTEGDVDAATERAHVGKGTVSTIAESDAHLTKRQFR
jgi:hypothetical protein